MITPAFLTPLDARKLREDTWILLADFRYRSAVGRALYVAPKGLVTDLASVPRLPMAYLLTGNTAHEAAVIHDLLYQLHVTDQATADLVFLEAMTVMGEPWWRREAMYLAVRLHGRASWTTGPARYRRFRNDLLSS